MFYLLWLSTAWAITANWATEYSLFSATIVAFVSAVLSFFISPHIFGKSASDWETPLSRITQIIRDIVIGPLAILFAIFLISFFFYAPDALLQARTEKAAQEAASKQKDTDTKECQTQLGHDQNEIHDLRQYAFFERGAHVRLQIRKVFIFSTGMVGAHANRGILILIDGEVENHGDTTALTDYNLAANTNGANFKAVPIDFPDHFNIPVENDTKDMIIHRTDSLSLKTLNPMVKGANFRGFLLFSLPNMPLNALLCRECGFVLYAKSTDDDETAMTSGKVADVGPSTDILPYTSPALNIDFVPHKHTKNESSVTLVHLTPGFP